MRGNGFALPAVALVGLLAGCTSPSDDPVPDPSTSATTETSTGTATSTATPRPDGDVALTEVCGTADAEAVERLLPGAEGEPGGTSGESYASATCTWANSTDDEPYGSLTLTVEVALTPDETEQRDVLEGVCGDAPVEVDGPGELACLAVANSGINSELTMHAIAGAALVDVGYLKATGGEVSATDQADLEQLAAGLIQVTPQP